MESTGPYARILTEAEIAMVVKAMRKGLGEDIARMIPGGTNAMADSVRFLPVAGHCNWLREAQGLTVKEAAAALRVPQYRLLDIEAGSTGRMRADVLLAYAAHLGVDPEWMCAWAEANRQLARKLGLHALLAAGEDGPERAPARKPAKPKSRRARRSKE